MSVRTASGPRAALDGRIDGEDERTQAARVRLAPIAGEYPFMPRFFVHPDGHAQHYVDEGPRAREAVVFVHGNPTWSFAWRRTLVALRPHTRCIAPDHLGCGLSDKPRGYPYRLARHAENLERLLASLALERVTLVLHDWGGPIGLGWARRHPEMVARLVLVNTAGFPVTGVGAAPERAPGSHPAPPAPLTHPSHPPAHPGGQTDGAIDGHGFRLPFRIAACRVPVFGKVAIQGLNAFVRAATWMAVERPLAPAVKRGYLLPYDSWQNRVATHAFVQDIPLGPGDPSWEELAAIERSLARFAHLPTQVLWGEHDWVFTPRFRDEWLPHADWVELEGVGHCPQLDVPIVTAHLIVGFTAH